MLVEINQIWVISISINWKNITSKSIDVYEESRTSVKRGFLIAIKFQAADQIYIDSFNVGPEGVSVAQEGGVVVQGVSVQGGLCLRDLCLVGGLSQRSLCQGEPPPTPVR